MPVRLRSLLTRYAIVPLAARCAAGAIAGAVTALLDEFALLSLPFVLLSVCLGGPVTAAAAAVAFSVVARADYLANPRPDWAVGLEGADYIQYAEWPPSSALFFGLATLLGLALWIGRRFLGRRHALKMRAVLPPAAR